MVRKAATLLAALLAVGSWSVATLGATGSWSVVASPNGVGQFGAELAGVSCVTRRRASRSVRCRIRSSGRAR